MSLASHPQPYPVREFHLPRPRSRGQDWEPHLHKVSPGFLCPARAPIPVLKGPQRQPLLRTELLHPHATLAIALDEAAPLSGATLYLTVRIDLHDSSSL